MKSENEGIIQSLGGINVILGIWLIVTPYIFGYTSSAAKWNQTIFGVVVLILAAIRLLLGGERYRRARKVLIQRGRADIMELGAVQRRLAEHARRERLAHGLTNALDSALAWQTIPVARRPPPSVRHLEARAGAVREIATALRTAEADIRAVAMVEELLDGGYAAPLYRLDCRALGDDLERIRFLLAAAPLKLTPV